MAHVCIQADECRVFIKNGKLRFQARKTDEDGEMLEQVMVSFPKELACYFTQVEDLDEAGRACKPNRTSQNRIQDYLAGGDR